MTAILIDRAKVVVANVGDSRAVVCRNGEAKQVSVDHEPMKEKDMVESKGGFVSHKPGILKEKICLVKYICFCNSIVTGFRVSSC